MSNELIGIKVGVDTSDVKSLKSQIKDATYELVGLSAKFGESSKEAANAAKRVAELKDRLGDAKNLVEQFNPDQKFRALTTVVGGAAAGFSTLQGAMGLFGSESENVAKSIQKVQAAMAFSQGINQLGDMKDAFKNAGTVIRTQVVTAFSTLKGAIISTGIGALVVGLGLLIANFDAVKSAILKAVPGLETFGRWVSKATTAVSDFLGITSNSSRALDKLDAAIKRSAESINNRIKLLSAQGGKEKEIAELRKQLINEETFGLNAKAKLGEKLSDEELTKRRSLANDLLVIDAEAKRKQSEADKAANDKSAAAAKAKAAADIKAEEDRVAKIQASRDKLLGMDGTTIGQDEVKAAAEAAAAEKKKREDEETNNTLENQKKVLAGMKGGLMEETKLSQEKVALTAKEVAEKKMLRESELQAASNALTALSDLVGQTTVAGKAMAIGASIINTYQGATKALAQGGFLGIASAAAVIATGLASVKRIISTPIPMARSGGSMPSVGGGGSVSPLQPTQTIGSQQVTLDQRSINAMGNQAVRAYVVETDITSSQSKVRRIEKSTKFG